MIRSVLLVLCLVSAVACATLSGYDPSRYESAAAAPAASFDPETTPLRVEERSRMVDPRRPLHDGGPRHATFESQASSQP